MTLVKFHRPAHVLRKLLAHAVDHCREVGVMVDAGQLTGGDFWNATVAVGMLEDELIVADAECQLMAEACAVRWIEAGTSV